MPGALQLRLKFPAYLLIAYNLFLVYMSSYSVRFKHADYSPGFGYHIDGRFLFFLLELSRILILQLFRIVVRLGCCLLVVFGIGSNR